MSRNLRALFTRELEYISGEWEDSEDGLDFSDDDDVADHTLDQLMSLKSRHFGFGNYKKNNRIPNYKLADEKVFKKESSGSSTEQVAIGNGIDVAVVTWRDNKIVTLASNFTGKHPAFVARMWDKSRKQ
ncbi:unnamed protein product [Euphydryas editha]|uniref:Uncharacterized protein n=1 Tax=Euphydryas editha TaxID=104508 RepID=A0AAU9TQV0_EUPED|nr:unnamed protein product [Euphydryas editha]